MVNTTPNIKKNIFNVKNLNIILKKINQSDIKDYLTKINEINSWIKLISNPSFLSATEKSLQGKFLDLIFTKVLNYSSIIDNPDFWNVSQEQVTKIDSKFADGALGFFSNQNKDVRVVIELKGGNVNLDEKQHRHNDNRTPIEQAFSYQHKIGSKCKWIIVSNYKEIRLYHHSSSTEYEVFNILDLANWDEFRKFNFLLSFENLISENSNSIIDVIYTNNENDERNITEEFYSNFKQIRTNLFEHLKLNNPHVDQLIILEKTQKFLDRFVFLCFCEDNRLLPEKTFKHIIETGKKSYAISETKIWNELKGLFQAINVGSPPHNINKFNGGLFATDTELDSLVIKDSILEEIAKLTEYDFETDIDVNILGHIFEQSISDIEEIKEKIEYDRNNKGLQPLVEKSDNGLQPLVEKSDNGMLPLVENATSAKKTSKRKKDGIFYTPEYITKYIVENAIGTWLDDRKKELGFYELAEISDEDFKEVKIVKNKILLNEKLQKHLVFWQAYKEILMNIKVLDPACGSGAFLNQAFNFLYSEGQIVNDRIAKFLGGQPELFGLDKHILSNNLFGVDLNSESIEITKLSLWIKTANNNSELTALDNNVKCGNSLIDDKDIAGDKAFIWNNEFAEIMQNGGFDVIIGNPPYGAELNNRNWLKNRYPQTSFGNIDSYKYFDDKGIELLRENGYLGFIQPDSYLEKEYFSDLRTLIVNMSSFIKTVKLGDNVFNDVNLPTSILFIKKNQIDKKKFVYQDVSENFKLLLFSRNNEIIDEPNYIQSFIVQKSLINKNDMLNLIDIFSQVMGVKVYQVGKGKPKQTEIERTKNKFVDKVKKDENYFPFISQGIERYWYENQGEYINYGEWLAEPREINYFENPKIVIREIVNPRIYASFIEYPAVVKNIAAVIIQKNKDFSLKYLLTLLNSKLLSYYLFQISSKRDNKTYPSFSSKTIKELPIPNIPIDNQKPFIELADIMIEKNKELQNIKNEFLTFIKTKFGIVKVNTKLEKWYKLEFDDFLKEISKAKVNLTLDEELSWQSLFAKQKTLANEIQKTIEETDKKIDEMVYQLYGLVNKDEIDIVEGRG